MIHRASARAASNAWSTVHLSKLMETNLFSALSKYGSNSEENYLTETFVVVLREMLARQPETANQLIARLVGADAGLFTNQNEIRIDTQSTTEYGRPDIEIRVGNSLVSFIEIKHDSPLGSGQLESYKAALDKLDANQKSLVLLARSRQAALSTTLAAAEFRQVCWYDIAEWLAACEIPDEVMGYFRDSFLTFLRTKAMTMNKVSWEYMNGVAAMIDLVDMLEAAVVEAIPTAKLRRTAGWNWRGVYLDGGFWSGIRFDNPLEVRYESGTGNDPSFARGLDLEAAHFFSLSSGEQLEKLISFVKQSKVEADGTIMDESLA